MLDTKLNDIKYAIFYDKVDAMKVITLKINHFNEISPHTSQSGSHQKIHNKCWRRCREKRTLIVGRNVNWYSHYGEQCEGSLKN